MLEETPFNIGYKLCREHSENIWRCSADMSPKLNFSLKI